MEIKTLNVSKGTWREINRLKFEMNCKRQEDVLIKLINNYENK